MRRKTTAALLAALCFILLLPGCGLRAAKDRSHRFPAQPWTLYSSAPEDVRFVDTYSCVAATEDRARIMEFFMTHDDEAELLIQSPYIRAKLQIMCDAVRRYFDTAGWGTPRWERFL